VAGDVGDEDGGGGRGAGGIGGQGREVEGVEVVAGGGFTGFGDGCDAPAGVVGEGLGRESVGDVLCGVELAGEVVEVRCEVVEFVECFDRDLVREFLVH